MDVIVGVSSKGQIVIPQEIRKSLGIHYKSQILFHLREDNVLELQPMKRNIRMFFRKGKLDEEPMTIEAIDRLIEQAVLNND